jgi:hypothetical protein
MRIPSRSTIGAWTLRASVLAAGLALTTGSTAWAQEPATQPAPGGQTAQPSQPAAAQPTAQAVTFGLDGGLMFWQVKPDRTADFEHILNKLKEALQKAEDPQRKQQATGWKVYKVQEPAPGGNVFYLFLIDPAVKGADYSSAAILKILYDTFPSEAQDLYKKLTESSAGGRNVLNLQLVTMMSQPGAAAPPVQPQE